jgi:hypothetical protein
MRLKRLLVALGVLMALAATVVGCGQRQGNTTGTGGPAGVQSEEASENDSIESTREEQIENQGSEEASENDSIESTREEQIESGNATP